MRREDDVRIDDQSQLHQRALLAVQELCRVGRLLIWTSGDRIHRVDRRQVSEKKDRTQLRRAAHLAAFNEDAAAGVGCLLRRRRNVGHGSVSASGENGVAVPVDGFGNTYLDTSRRGEAQSLELGDVGAAPGSATGPELAGRDFDLTPEAGGHQVCDPGDGYFP